MDLPVRLPSSLLSEFSSYVADRMGLHFPEKRWGDLERGLSTAAREFGLPNAESCVRWLLTASLTRNHVEILASHLTVGETYFFRERQSLDALEQHIVPELLSRRRNGERHLRIWSAGCCTGEEPYSVAMLLDRMVPDPEAWKVTILATDINPHFLRKAAEGVYGEWSFRGTPDWVKQRYFTQRRDGFWELIAQIRKRVTFSYLNLAEDVYPSLSNNTNAMDVILCRNVLMYFTAEQARQVSQKFCRSLVDGGCLIVSPTETSNSLFSLFSAAVFAGTTLYRMDGASGPCTPVVESQAPRLAIESNATTLWTPAPASASAVAEITPPDALSDAPQEPRGPATLEQDDALASGTIDGDRAAAAARNCANQGNLTEAIEWCQMSISADKLNPARHYLLAAIRQEQGEADAAVQSLTRALYLDSGFVLARFALGNIESSRGRWREAERHFANALGALRMRPHDQILPESDGLTAGRLAEIISSALASLPPVVAHA